MRKSRTIISDNYDSELSDPELRMRDRRKTRFASRTKLQSRRRMTRGELSRMKANPDLEEAGVVAARTKAKMIGLLQTMLKVCISIVRKRSRQPVELVTTVFSLQSRKHGER